MSSNPISPPTSLQEHSQEHSQELEKAAFSNHQTWNICYWLTQDEGFAQLARKCGSYKSFLKEVDSFPEGKLKHMTPDDVRWHDKAISIKEVDTILQKMI